MSSFKNLTHFALDLDDVDSRQTVAIRRKPPVYPCPLCRSKRLSRVQADRGDCCEKCYQR